MKAGDGFRCFAKILNFHKKIDRNRRSDYYKIRKFAERQIMENEGNRRNGKEPSPEDTGGEGYQADHGQDKENVI